MKIIITKPHLQVIALGVLAGMRSMAATAVASKMLGQHHSKKLEGSPLNFMQSDVTANVLGVMAVGEFIGDKMPSTPNRIATPGLVFRSLSGAVAGASIYKAKGNNAYIGAVLGGVTAAAATFGSFFLRKALVKQSHLIDPVIGTLEDAIVLGASAGLTHSM